MIEIATFKAGMSMGTEQSTTERFSFTYDWTNSPAIADTSKGK